MKHLSSKSKLWSVVTFGLLSCCSPAAPSSPQTPAQATPSDSPAPPAEEAAGAASRSPAAPVKPAGPAAPVEPAESLPPSYRVAGKAPVEAEIDGDLSEWNPADFVPSTASLVVHPNPDGLLVAARLKASYKGGAWLRITFPRQPLPFFGYFDRGAGGLVSADCMHEFGYERTPLLTASDRKACEAAREQREALGRDYQRSLTGWYRLDAKGVQRWTPGEGLGPIENAELGASEARGGLAIELSLPARALPCASTSPVTDFVVELTPLSAWASPPLDVEDEPLLRLPTPLSFAPDAEVRNHVWAKDTGPMFVPVLIYQPGEAGAVDIIEHGSQEGDGPYGKRPIPIERVQRPLTRPLGRLNQHEVVVDARDFVLLLSPAEPPRTLLDSAPDIARHVKASNELHLASATEFVDMASLKRDAYWEVAVLQADGNVRHFRLWNLPPDRVDSATTFQEDNYKVLGIRVVIRPDGPDGPPHTVTLRWRYNTKSKMYESSDERARTN